MSAREEILTRIRAATTDLAGQPAPTVTWDYGRPTAQSDTLGLFVERVEDYRARVVGTTESALTATLTEEISALGLSSVLVPSGVDAGWREAVSAAGAQVVADAASLTPRDLDAVSGVLTAARVGIAETGTVVLDHDLDQGRRALTLVPDTHLCVVRADQVVSDVPEAVALLAASVAAGRPLTWISGPSATSDIELDRVEGVHGPRHLVVVLVRPTDP